MKFANLILLFSLIGLCAGCAAPAPAVAVETLTPQPSATQPAPSAAPSPTAAATPLPGLTLAGLKNGTYRVPMYDRPVQLLDGKYEAGSGADYFMAMLIPEKIAFGDLNQDGLDDAAIFIAENGGGSGVFVSLMVVYNQSGRALQGGSLPIDDRPRINAVTIQSGVIRMEGVIHGPGDVMANPTLAVVELFEADGAQLTLVNFSSKTADGRERSIKIESPANRSAVSQSVQVKGSMLIAPFENNLAYRIFDQAGKQLAMGPFPVSADEPGGPAVFDQTIDLSGIPAGLVRLELVEVSMANGSTLTMNSLTLTVK